MDVKCLETSTMIPVPTTWPAREVPAVRGISDVFSVFARAISFSRSFFDFGIATASGISRYADASVAYSVRIVESKYRSPSSWAESWTNFSLIPGFIGVQRYVGMSFLRLSEKRISVRQLFYLQERNFCVTKQL